MNEKKMKIIKKNLYTKKKKIPKIFQAAILKSMK